MTAIDFFVLPQMFTQCSIPVCKENIPVQDDLKDWPYLKDVQLNSIEAEVGLLIGTNVPKAMEPWNIINSRGDGPYAVKTRLRWVINGPLGSSPSIDEYDRPCVTSNKISVAKLEELVVKQYNQDFSECKDEKAEYSAEDKRFLKIAADSVVKRDGHFQLRLPSRKEVVKLPNNKRVAEQRASNLIKRFRRDEAYYKDYNAFMSDILKKRHAERVPEDQLQRDDGRVWYIPHHGVYHKTKKKIRVVFDCAAPFQQSENCESPLRSLTV